MGCFRPYFKSFAECGDYKVPLPCGNCEYCRYQNSKNWSLRLLFESLRYKQGFAFVTLTYSNEFCPSDYALKPSHLQAFVKRLRYYLDAFNVKIKFFASAEYGSKRGRPHYHLIIFGLVPALYPLVRKAWSYGMIDIQQGHRGSLRYVTNYVMKKIGSMKEVRKYYYNRIPPFMRCSKGLGLYFVEISKTFTEFVSIEGKRIFIGRYLKNKLADKFGLSEYIKGSGLMSLYERSLDIYCKYLGKYDYEHGTMEKTYYHLHNEQFKRDFFAKLKLKGLINE